MYVFTLTKNIEIKIPDNIHGIMKLSAQLVRQQPSNVNIVAAPRVLIAHADKSNFINL